jgi:type IV pilus assembly protein PilY1
VQYDNAATPSTPLNGTANLLQQSISGTYAATVANTGSDYRTVTSYAVCWADTAGCSQYGWYLNLVSGNAYPPDPAVPQNGNANYANAPVVWEQVIYNPTILFGAFVVNTTIPSATAATMCFSSATSGWTMSIDPASGGAFTVSSFDNPGNHTPINVTTTTTVNGNNDTQTYGISGVAASGTGSVSGILGGNQAYGIMQTSGQVAPGGTPPKCTNPLGCGSTNLLWLTKHNLVGKRVTWTQRR